MSDLLNEEPVKKKKIVKIVKKKKIIDEIESDSNPNLENSVVPDPVPDATSDAVPDPINDAVPDKVPDAVPDEVPDALPSLLFERFAFNEIKISSNFFCVKFFFFNTSIISLIVTFLIEFSVRGDTFILYNYIRLKKLKKLKINIKYFL